ncbi:hypothetical protein MMC07_008007 [Pseudocyphellaria aurata]|nr:hypothetical protein [Pseudocyphellaria aurata]
MSFSYWPSSSSAANSTSSATPTLDFLQVLNSSRLALSRYRDHVSITEASASVGSGGQAVVELSCRPGIVIKRSRRFKNGESSHVPHTDRDLSLLTLELRILADDFCRRYGLFVKVMGLCYEESNAGLDPFAAGQFHLLLEYSELGDMASFLRRNGQQLDPKVKLELARQVSFGLATLHQDSICHGDLKLQNILVFNGKDGGYVAKLADFGISLYSYRTLFDESPDTFAYPLGTPLLNAPEVRTRNPSTRLVDIPAVIRADIFSFGLLLWEAIKHGQSYFNMAWLDTARASKLELGMEEQIAFLSNLPSNGLLMRGEEFLASQDIDEELFQQSRRVFHASLQDDPLQRQPMVTIAEILSAPKTEKARSAFNELRRLSIRDAHGFQTWNASLAKIDILDLTCFDLPDNIQRRALDELKVYATSYSADDDFDGSQALRWLKFDPRTPCLSRISETLESPPEISGGPGAQLETISEGKEIECCAISELFLVREIQRKVASAVTQIRALSSVVEPKHIGLVAKGEVEFEIDSHISTGEDYMTILEIAALLGEDKTLARLLLPAEALFDTKDLINALRCAFIGGNLSSLKIVLDYGVDLSLCGENNISPMHLLIYVPADLVDGAVGLLIDHGAPTDTRSEATKSRILGFDLIGTPVEWAVIARNRGLVAALLPHSNGQERSILRHAISYAYYEIADDLLSNSNLSGLFTEEDCPVLIFPRPFPHLIAHGRDGNLAIERTIRLCDKHGLINYDFQLEKCIIGARTRSCLKSLEVLLELCSRSAIRRGFESDVPEGKMTSILYTAFASAKSNTAWRPILETLLRNFSITELQDTEEPKNYCEDNVIYTAVVLGWTLAVRIMLEKGVDIQCKSEWRNLTLFDIAVLEGDVEMQALLSEYGGRDTSSPNYNQDVRWIALQNLSRHRGFEHLVHSNLGEKDSSTLPATSKARELLYRLLSVRNTDNEGKPAMPKLCTPLWNAFRGLISNELLIGHVDVPDEDNVTMLQQAAAFLDVEVVKLLLEAGADANVPFIAKSAGDSENSLVIPFLPFQITCWMARVTTRRMERTMIEKQQQSNASSTPEGRLEPTGKTHILRRITQEISHAVGLARAKGARDPETSQNRSAAQGTTSVAESSGTSSFDHSWKTRALDVARVILRWHQLRDDGRFQGITEFHLNVHIWGVEHALMLAEQEGWNTDARASWPGIEGKYTGAELGQVPWKDERRIFSSEFRKIHGAKYLAQAKERSGKNSRDPEV